MLIICRALSLDSRGKTRQRQISHFLWQIISVCKTKIISFVKPKMRTSAFSWKFCCCCWQKCLLLELRFNDDSFLIGIFARNIFYLSKQVAFLPLRTNSQHHYNWIAPWNCQIYEIRDALSLHLDWSDRSFHQFRSITDTLEPRRIKSGRRRKWSYSRRCLFYSWCCSKMCRGAPALSLCHRFTRWNLSISAMLANIWRGKHICKQFLIGQFGDTALPCTDDSDCISLGWKYGCFLYRWQTRHC